MKKFKRTVSTIITAAMAVTAFTGFSITANAEDLNVKITGVDQYNVKYSGGLVKNGEIDQGTIPTGQTGTVKISNVVLAEKGSVVVNTNQRFGTTAITLKVGDDVIGTGVAYGGNDYDSVAVTEIELNKVPENATVLTIGFTVDADTRDAVWINSIDIKDKVYKFNDSEYVNEFCEPDYYDDERTVIRHWGFEYGVSGDPATTKIYTFSNVDLSGMDEFIICAKSDASINVVSAKIGEDYIVSENVNYISQNYSEQSFPITGEYPEPQTVEVTIQSDTTEKADIFLDYIRFAKSDSKIGTTAKFKPGDSTTSVLKMDGITTDSQWEINPNTTATFVSSNKVDLSLCNAVSIKAGIVKNRAV